MLARATAGCRSEAQLLFAREGEMACLHVCGRLARYTPQECKAMSGSWSCQCTWSPDSSLPGFVLELLVVLEPKCLCLEAVHMGPQGFDIHGYRCIWACYRAFECEGVRNSM